MQSLLIANRGEIAVRVIRAAQERGLRTIAVYSELDRDALHVTMADEAWNIGGAPAAESYLNIDHIMKVAGDAGADAVHPGYGFLAENAVFARTVEEAGLVWVGPPADAIVDMGDKIRSRNVAAEAGVPGVPGSLQPVESVADAARLAGDFGYPVAIKAAHGGGGKGLRVVHEEGELEAGFESAAREADAYFGNPELYVEKYLIRPRHVEAQIIFDNNGHGMFLGERDCSIQRRHQKLIEESPAPGIDEAQRQALGEAALAVARQVGYRNAGTVEFLLSAEGEFYFLEMNTRLQVEHPVTEMVTGIDLVAEQLRVAGGEDLSIGETPPTHGHAIELRINAEDPSRGFLPTPGTIVEWHEPGGFGVRVDSGVTVGAAVSQYYDNLLAKLVVWGSDRQTAIARARRAAGNFRVSGVATTLPAHHLVLDHPDFVAGRHHTLFVEETIDFSGMARPTAPAVPEEEELVEREMTVEVGGRRFQVRFWAPEPAPAQAGRKAAPRRRPPRLERSKGDSEEAGLVIAPMQGTIVKVHHKAGDRVKADDPLCVLEAMKMENEIRAPIDGEIVDLRMQSGDTVAAGAVLAIVR
ncbi:MAG: acetyl/propionyl/methylcrotonyl-CoA carboxylase subunit alpha [Acidimicrobiia bacterium]